MNFIAQNFVTKNQAKPSQSSKHISRYQLLNNFNCQRSEFLISNSFILLLQRRIYIKKKEKSTIMTELLSGKNTSEKKKEM